MPVTVMLDFETLSLAPNAVLLSLGAVAVDTATGETVSEFHAHIDPASQPHRKIDASTVYWWLKQSDAARTKLTSVLPLDAALAALPEGATDAEVDAVYTTSSFSLSPVAQAFVGFYGSLPGEPEVWANGAVDHAWLDSMMADAGLKNPVPYWKQRDYRTLKNLLPWVKADDMEGFVAHDALWDAKWQAAHLVKLLRAVPSAPDDMSDWRNWERGDVVRTTTSDDEQFEIISVVAPPHRGREAVVDLLTSDGITGVTVGSSEVRWHYRPSDTPDA